MNQEHPATAFLSYSRKDVEEVKALQLALNVRGVRAWRDVTHMQLGSYNEEEVIHAIEQECDVFVLYVTQQVLKSDFIWRHEVPAALRRWEHDRAFKIIPLLQGVTLEELEDFCADHGHRSLKEFNGANVADPNIIRRILESALDERLRRVQADRKYEPCLCLCTYPYEPPTSSLDLELDWSGLFPSKDELPAEEDWDNILLPALNDLAQVLNARTSSRRLHIFVQAHLPAAFALGFAFPAAAHLILLLEGRHGIWSTEVSGQASEPLRCLPYKRDSDSPIAVVEIAIANDITGAVSKNLPILGLAYKYRLRFELPDGPDHVSGVKDSSHALAMSHQIGRELRRLRSKEGISHIHLFAALPAALAVMVGHQINALCPITLYHYLEKEERYQAVCVLGKRAG